MTRHTTLIGGLLALLVVTAGVAATGLAAADDAPLSDYPTADDDDAARDGAGEAAFAPEERPVPDVDPAALAARLGERFDLTDDQITELEATIERLVEADATRAEMRRVIGAKLLDFGVDRNELKRALVTHRVDRLADRYDLTRAQTVELRQEVRDMHRLGLGPRAIRAGVIVELEGFGVDTTDLRRAYWADRFERFADRHDLTDDQRTELRELIRDLHADGASRAEIREAVRERVAEWGIDADDDRVEDDDRTEAGDRAEDSEAADE